MSTERKSTCKSPPFSASLIRNMTLKLILQGKRLKGAPTSTMIQYIYVPLKSLRYIHTTLNFLTSRHQFEDSHLVGPNPSRHKVPSQFDST